MTRFQCLNKGEGLADVIAAIRAKAYYNFYKLDFKGWSERVTGTPDNAACREQVSKDPPEFFRPEFIRLMPSGAKRS